MMGIDDNNDTHEYNDILTEEEGHHLGTPTNKNCALHVRIQELVDAVIT